MEDKMGKYIGRIVLKTLCFTVATVILLVGIFVLAFPTQSSQLSSKVGADSLATSFAKIAYERSGDINDLANVVEKGIYSNSYEKVVEYGSLFMDDSNFEAYCQFKDATFAGANYKQFIIGNYAIALIKTNQEQAISFLNSLSKDSYPLNNTLTYAVYGVIESQNKDGLIEVAKCLDSILFEIYNNKVEGLEFDYITIDGLALSQTFGLKSESSWQSIITAK